MRGWHIRSPRVSSRPFRATSCSSPPRGTGLLPHQGNPDVPDSCPPGAPTSPGGAGPTPRLSPARPHSPSSSGPACPELHQLPGAVTHEARPERPRPCCLGSSTSAPAKRMGGGPRVTTPQLRGPQTLTTGQVSSTDLRGPLRHGPVQRLGPSSTPGEVPELHAPMAPHLCPASRRPPKHDQTLQAGPGAPTDPEGNTQAHLRLEGGFSGWCAMRPAAQLQRKTPTRRPS
ncbi:hypothetical protein NDU88_001892 [Pleurodeles waltl]|uniref:Uncharacterized protein n=1 Tax=Pleurodeles waltl TaxID=8319 RepID=A0AAV7Q8E6_PLEWA|nr:hypothetical protein NDU88_001892 [Pleurodeles waltl]